MWYAYHIYLVEYMQNWVEMAYINVAKHCHNGEQKAFTFSFYFTLRYAEAE